MITNRQENLTDLGEIKLHTKVIASIANLACLEVQGVKRVEGRFIKRIFNFIRLQDSPGIKVELAKNGEVGLRIPLVLQYGCNIPEVATRVQENVRQALERMANIYTKDIDIDIRGIEK